MRDLIFIDTETTGLDRNADIWEIGALRHNQTRSEWVGIHLLVEHDQRKCAGLPDSFRADHEQRFDHTSKVVVSRREAAERIDDFTKIRNGTRPILIGSAPDFDAKHLERLMRSAAGRKPEWDHQLVGIVPLMLGYLGPEAAEIPHTSEALSRAIGINPDKFERHTAMGDVLWTIAIYDRIMAGSAMTDDDLRRIDMLVQQHVINQPIPIIPTEQGQAVAEIVRAVPGLLRLIAAQRQAEEEQR